MKRLSTFLLLFVLAFGFTGCENQALETEKQSEISTPVMTTAEPTPVEPEVQSVEPEVQSVEPEVQSVEKTEPLPEEDSTVRYIGNKNSHKFHRTSCRALPDEKNRVYLQSREEAIDSYYKSCKKCNP